MYEFCIWHVPQIKAFMPFAPRWRGLRRKPHCHGHAKRMRVEAALAIVGLPYGERRVSKN
jgi:hypothetical protein